MTVLPGFEIALLLPPLLFLRARRRARRRVPGAAWAVRVPEPAVAGKANAALS